MAGRNGTVSVSTLELCSLELRPALPVHTIRLSRPVCNAFLFDGPFERLVCTGTRSGSAVEYFYFSALLIYRLLTYCVTNASLMYRAAANE